MALCHGFHLQYIIHIEIASADHPTLRALSNKLIQNHITTVHSGIQTALTMSSTPIQHYELRG